MSNAPVSPSFLLVHGAWHQPTCWSALQDALAADGLQRLDTGHSPFLSAPAELAALLGKITSAEA
ncbi:hypothetical protein QZH56_02475 [Streptomyces olivoreticuli]|uniref:hypothetical protein n=1 Tax=Streptomyces olivoreticuli TaxID=68246 RepID=UPI00265833E5|nr:hypothetical protein [Streptomyces olivoreticuli]WKK24538.1 hypothetical protein QZH56_02475 [Streptomyces olivoreticuli]